MYHRFIIPLLFTILIYQKSTQNMRHHEKPQTGPTYLETLRKSIREEPLLIDAAATPDLPLTYNQIRILAALSRLGGAPIGNLSAWLGVSPTTGTSLADHLEDKRLVTKVRGTIETDRRVRVLFITELGRKAIKPYLYQPPTLAETMRANEIQAGILGAEFIED